MEKENKISPTEGDLKTAEETKAVIDSEEEAEEESEDKEEE